MAALAGLLVGCSSNPKIKDVTTFMGDTSDIEVTSIRTVLRGGLLTVNATILNDGNDSLVAYRFKWFSENGVIVGEEEPWKPLLVKEDASKDVLGIAPTADATSFKLELNSHN